MATSESKDPKLEPFVIGGPLAILNGVRLTYRTFKQPVQSDIIDVTAYFNHWYASRLMYVDRVSVSLENGGSWLTGPWLVEIYLKQRTEEN